MGMGNSFETITVLQYRLKEAQEELAAFQSGEKYIRKTECLWYARDRNLVVTVCW